MKAKVFLAKARDVVLGFVSGVMVILACNPISMFGFNLFFPANAATFVREFIGFNNFWRNFYTRRALKWPLIWSRYWITMNNLKTCGVQKQVAYYWSHRTLGEVLRSMSPEAQVALVRRHPDWIDRIYEQMRLTDDMFDAWLHYLVKKDYKSNPQNKRDCQKLYEPLDIYLKTGKLPFSQVMMLTRVAVDEYNNSSCPLMKKLEDYIERFGQSKKQLEEMAQYMCDNLYWHDIFSEEPTTQAEKEFAKHQKFKHFYNILAERQINYDQRIFTRSQRGEKRTEKWKTFCENTDYICVAAQKEMDIEQYRIFHAVGKALRTETIAYFLRYPDRTLHLLVFRYEPVEMFDNIDIQHVINGNVYLKEVFETEMAKRPGGTPRCYTAKEVEAMGFSTEVPKQRIRFFKSPIHYRMHLSE